MNYNKIKYTTSSIDVFNLPNDVGFEIAFVGRSNVGKSSLLNSVANKKYLTKVSKSPGKTRLINIFNLDNNNKLVDLPGYGYANVSKIIRYQLNNKIKNYLMFRKSLKGVIFLLDARHNLNKFDCFMIDLILSLDLNLHILLTKFDKLNIKEKIISKMMIESFIKKYFSTYKISYQFFSSLNKIGLNTILKIITSWFYSFNKFK